MDKQILILCPVFARPVHTNSSNEIFEYQNSRPCLFFGKFFVKNSFASSFYENVEDTWTFAQQFSSVYYVSSSLPPMLDLIPAGQQLWWVGVLRVTNKESN